MQHSIVDAIEFKHFLGEKRIASIVRKLGYLTNTSTNMSLTGFAAKYAV
jgi:hypothetical protein